MSEPTFKPVDITEALGAVDLDTLQNLLAPKRRGRNVPPPKVEKPRIRSVEALFVGGYLDGVRRPVPYYYVEEPQLLYRTINPASKPERGMELDRLFGECFTYRVTVQGDDGAFIFEQVI